MVLGLLRTRATRPRVGALPSAQADPRELARVAVAPAPLAPRCDDVIPRDDRQFGFVFPVAGVADEQARTAWGEAGLDPPVAPSAQLARHQYSSGRRMVVTDLSASVITQMHFSPTA